LTSHIKEDKNTPLKVQDCLGGLTTLTAKIQQILRQWLESFLLSPLPSPAWGWHKGMHTCAAAVLTQRLTASLKSPMKVVTQFLY